VDTRAERIARELGLNFTTTTSGDGKWLRFKFDFPGSESVKVQNTITFPKALENAELPKSLTETIRRVTTWRNRISPWLLLGTVDTVASQQTIGTRVSVALWNRKNRKRIKLAAKALGESEAYARKLALTQPTPMQGVRVLDDLTKLAESETQVLRKQLIEAAQTAERIHAEALAHAEGKCGEGCPVCAAELAEKSESGVTYESAQVVNIDEARARRTA
jgi:hypothetical protein